MAYIIILLTNDQKDSPWTCSVCFSSTRFGAAKTILCTQNIDFCDEVRCFDCTSFWITNLSHPEISWVIMPWHCSCVCVIQVTKHLCDRWNIVQRVSPAEAPQLNPLHDRSSGLLKEAVTQVVTEKQAEWDDFLDPVLFLFRTSTNPSTKFTPYSLMFNRKASFPNEVLDLFPPQLALLHNTYNIRSFVSGPFFLCLFKVFFSCFFFFFFWSRLNLVSSVMTKNRMCIPQRKMTLPTWLLCRSSRTLSSSW